METKVINQKAYLEKYMSSGDNDEKKKKKKKKLKTGTKTVKIIDDDIDLKNMRPIKEDELDICLLGEDAPQIAGIVDDRGPVDFTDKRRWKIINEDGDLTIINRTIDKEKRNQDDEINAKWDESDDSDLSPSGSKQYKDRNPSPHERPKDDDLSPPRLKHFKEKKHKDPNLRKRAHDNDSDLSPPRHSKNKYADSKLHKRSKDDDSDLSPPRHSKHKHADSNLHKRSKDNDSNLSPPRKSKNYDSDLSPPRQSRNNDSDSSPPRRSTKHHTSTNNTSGRSYRMSGNKDNNSDLSSSRKGKQNLDTNLNKSRKNKDRDADLSRFRRKEHRSRRDNSPRFDSHRDERDYDYRDRNSNKDDASRSNKIKVEREYEDRDRKSRSYPDIRNERKKSRWDDQATDFEREHTENHSKDHDRRLTKTLDGKKAGLQDAKASREETKALKRREIEEFKMMEFTGEGQVPILRNKESGRKRNLEAEAAEKYEQEKRQQELNEQYDKWGKGLKQIKDREERLQDELYEMSKPLARYADDADLDKQLREELKDGDPMLEYIKQKQIKEGKRKPDPPQYQGSYAPNRFGIKPGYRWDGVDRSNGYEKKWFETQNAKKARQEEAYKWSTADM